MNKTVLVVGSGPIIIGQAAEFDYAGAQACKSLREEGYRVVLINSNPATIMTDTEMADRIYIEPITPEIVEKIIIKEKPFGILGTLGGQTGLNLTSELNNLGILEKYKVEKLSTFKDPWTPSQRLKKWSEELGSLTLEKIGPAEVTAAKNKITKVCNITCVNTLK